MSTPNELSAHFFRNEYGRMLAVVTKYIGAENWSTAEDIVQETMLRAVNHWQLKGIPANPQAWLYTVAKNLTLNYIKRRRKEAEYKSSLQHSNGADFEINLPTFSEHEIQDEQLKVMFDCCHPSISKDTQVALILKILCGFSITEIANAFFSNNETINKRLVRGRKQLRQNLNLGSQPDLEERLPVVLKTIFLLFNEGYSPSHKEAVIRYDLCLEAIRLVRILVKSTLIEEKDDCYALLGLMYLNASRFESRMNSTNTIVELSDQNRSTWNQELINKGLDCLNSAIDGSRVSIYLILATISANHSTAPSFEETNWREILALYDALLELNNSPIIKLNRSVALAKVEGNDVAIAELESLKSESKLARNHLYHSTIGELYKLTNSKLKAGEHFRKAITFAKNPRDIELLERKLAAIVPNDQTRLS